MKFKQQLLAAAAASLLVSSAWSASVTLTQLSGLTGGTLAGTAVYKGDLSAVGVGSILSVQITDNSAGLGGAPGQFSGFDLDAIKLSYTDCATAACAASAAGLAIFDFAAGTLFAPGAQRTPADPRLFGTDGTGAAVDDSVATLGAFDGESTTVTPFGFLSMGDNGSISFNLTAAALSSGLFLYIGEVGDNGEVAAGSITVNNNRVPEPGSLTLAGLALAGLTATARRRKS